MRTDREKLETLLEILLVVGLQCGSPCLELGFEGHCGEELVEGRGI